MKIPPKIW